MNWKIKFVFNDFDKNLNASDWGSIFIEILTIKVHRYGKTI